MSRADGDGRPSHEAVANLIFDAPDGRPRAGQGLRVPTLQEMFETFPDDFMVIEIKGTDPSVSVDYARMIREYGREQSVITASFSEDVLVAFREQAPDALTSMAQDEVIFFFALTPEAEADYTPPGQFLHVPPTFSGIEVMNEDFAARAARFDLPIHVFGTGNDPEGNAAHDRSRGPGVDGRRHRSRARRDTRQRIEIRTLALPSDVSR